MYMICTTTSPDWRTKEEEEEEGKEENNTHYKEKRKRKGVPSGANTRHIFDSRSRSRDRNSWPEGKSKIGTTHDKNHIPGSAKNANNYSSLSRKREEGRG